MATSVNIILAEARKYIGVTGGSVTHKMIIDKYNDIKPLPQGYRMKYSDDWCDAFISFLAIKTGAMDIIGRECGVERHIGMFKSLGIWYEDGTITPMPGDIITFNWQTNIQPNDGFADHIGIVESVTNGKIYTIEGNSRNMVKRREYAIGSGYIRGYARPKYTDSSIVKTSTNYEYNGGDLINSGRKLPQNHIQSIIRHAKRYNLKPSFLIAQLFIESHWGDPNDSKVAKFDNNWAGISEPFKVPESLDIKVSRGTVRPVNEGGYYVHFETMEDFFKAYTYILSSQNGLYNVEHLNNIEDFCKGLFKYGGAKANYAAGGYEHYKNMLIPTYHAIIRQNSRKVEAIDRSSFENISSVVSSVLSSDTSDFKRISENGKFYPNQRLAIRDYPSRSGKIMGHYNNGQSLNYDSYVVNDGHIWLSYVSYAGNRRYIAWRVQNGGKFGVIK